MAELFLVAEVMTIYLLSCKEAVTRQPRVMKKEKVSGNGLVVNNTTL